jgi:carboxylesterase type B
MKAILALCLCVLACLPADAGMCRRKVIMNELSARRQTEREEAAKTIAALQDRMSKIDARLDTISGALGLTDDAIKRTEVAMKALQH